MYKMTIQYHWEIFIYCMWKFHPSVIW